jgi:4-hydroxybenzoate polyprenyltransferase and related prenyltransferases
MVRKFVRQVVILLEMIKFEHTVFALPFALLSALLAARGLPEWRTLGWILVAMVGARSAAMAFNRIADWGSSRVDLQACKLGTGRRFTTS